MVTWTRTSSMCTRTVSRQKSNLKEVLGSLDLYALSHREQYIATSPSCQYRNAVFGQTCLIGAEQDVARHVRQGECWR